MGGSQGMHVVELVEASEPAGAADRPARRRVPLILLAGAVCLVLVALALVQLAIRARERDEIASLDGILTSLDTAPTVLWSDDQPTQALWHGPLGDDAVAAVRMDQDGTRRIVALDATTGRQRWSTVLAEPSPARVAALAAGDGVSASSPCASPAEGVSVPFVACLVTDAFTRWSNTSIEAVPATSTTLQIVDAADGSVLQSMPVRGSSLLVIPGLVVVAGRTDNGIEVSAYDPVSGRRAWLREVASGTPAASAYIPDTVEMFGSGRYLGVRSLVSTVLLSTDGAIVRADLGSQSSEDGLRIGVDGRVFFQQGSDAGATTTLVATDGTTAQDVTVPGGVVTVGTDDHSVPGLLLTTGTGLRAFDDVTGAPRWEAADVHLFAGTAVIVLHGVVYLRSTTGIVAVDGRTGAVRWQTPVRSDWQQIRTDGRRLLIIGWPTEVSDPGTLVTYALDDGHELWRVDYPAGVVAVDAVGHRLYGWRADGSLVALG